MQLTKKFLETLPGRQLQIINYLDETVAQFTIEAVAIIPPVGEEVVWRSRLIIRRLRYQTFDDSDVPWPENMLLIFNWCGKLYQEEDGRIIGGSTFNGYEFVFLPEDHPKNIKTETK